MPGQIFGPGSGYRINYGFLDGKCCLIINSFLLLLKIQKMVLLSGTPLRNSVLNW